MEDVLGKTLEECVHEEHQLQFETFTNDQALELGLAIVERARRMKKSVTVNIERNGQQLFRFAMEGSAIDNAEWVKRKVRVVNRVGMSSYRFRLQLESKGYTMRERGLDEMLYANAGGAFPVRVRNVGVVGSIGVSGLPQEQDHALIVDSIGEFISK